MTHWGRWCGIVGCCFLFGVGGQTTLDAAEDVISPSLRQPLVQAMTDVLRDQHRIQHPIGMLTPSQWVMPVLPTESVTATWQVTVNAIRLSPPGSINEGVVNQMAGSMLGKVWQNTDLLLLGQRLTDWCWVRGWIYTYVLPERVTDGVLDMTVYEGRINWVDAPGLSPWERVLAFGLLEGERLNAWHIERGLSHINRVGQVRWRWVPHPTAWGEGGIQLTPLTMASPRVVARYQLDALYWHQPASIELVWDRPLRSLDQLMLTYGTSVSHERLGVTHIILTESMPWGPFLWRFTHARSSFIQVVDGIYRPVMVTGQNESNRLSVEWECVRDQGGVHTIMATYQSSFRVQRVNGFSIPITQQHPWVMGIGWVWQPWHDALNWRLYPMLTWSDGYQKLYLDASVSGMPGVSWQWGIVGQYALGELPAAEYMGMGSGGVLGGFEPSYWGQHGLIMNAQLSHALWAGSMTYQWGAGWIVRDGDVGRVGIRLTAMSGWHLGGLSFQLGWEQGLWASHAQPIGGLRSGLSLGL